MDFQKQQRGLQIKIGKARAAARRGGSLADKLALLKTVKQLENQLHSLRLGRFDDGVATC